MAVIKGEYHSIIASAPKNVTAFVMTESNWERSSASMLAASLVSAERYAAVLSARKEEMLFLCELLKREVLILPHSLFDEARL